MDGIVKNFIMMGSKEPKELAKMFREEFEAAYGPSWTCSDCYVSIMNFQDANGRVYPMSPRLSGPQKAGGVYSMIVHAINEGVSRVGIRLSA